MNAVGAAPDVYSPIQSLAAWAGNPTPGRRERRPPRTTVVGLALSVTPPSLSVIVSTAVLGLPSVTPPVGSAERQVDRLVPLHEGIVHDRDADGLVGRVASGKADGLAHGRVVRGRGGGAVAGRNTDAYRASAAARARDRDGGIAPILRHAEGRGAQLYTAGPPPTVTVKLGLVSQEREAIVGKQAELIGARRHRAGHPKRTGPGRPRRARRLRAADIYPLDEC